MRWELEMSHNHGIIGEPSRHQVCPQTVDVCVSTCDVSHQWVQTWVQCILTGGPRESLLLCIGRSAQQETARDKEEGICYGFIGLSKNKPATIKLLRLLIIIICCNKRGGCSTSSRGGRCGVGRNGKGRSHGGGGGSNKKYNNQSESHSRMNFICWRRRPEGRVAAGWAVAGGESGSHMGGDNEDSDGSSICISGVHAKNAHFKQHLHFVFCTLFVLY